MSQNVINKPHHQKLFQPKVHSWKNLEKHTGIMIPEEDLENCADLRPLSPFVTVRKDNTVSI